MNWNKWNKKCAKECVIAGVGREGRRTSSGGRHDDDKLLFCFASLSAEGSSSEGVFRGLWKDEHILCSIGRTTQPDGL